MVATRQVTIRYVTPLQLCLRWAAGPAYSVSPLSEVTRQRSANNAQIRLNRERQKFVHRALRHDHLISTLLPLPDTSTVPDLTRTWFPAESTATESVYSLPLMVTLVCCSFDCCSFLAWQPNNNRQKNRRFFTFYTTDSPPVKGSISPTKADVSFIINSLICRRERETPAEERSLSISYRVAGNVKRPLT
jgi:hypothetical protein